MIISPPILDYTPPAAAWIEPRPIVGGSSNGSAVLTADDPYARAWLEKLFSVSVAAPAAEAAGWMAIKSISVSASSAPKYNESSTYIDYSRFDDRSIYFVPTGGGNLLGLSGSGLGFSASAYGGDHDLSMHADVEFPMKAAVDEIAALRDGWDGPGTVAPSNAAVAGARDFLQSLAPGRRLPDVAAGRDGEVNISWRDRKSFVDLSFYRTGGASLYARVDGSIFKVPSGVLSCADLPSAVAACITAG